MLPAEPRSPPSFIFMPPSVCKPPLRGNEFAEGPFSRTAIKCILFSMKLKQTTQPYSESGIGTDRRYQRGDKKPRRCDRMTDK
jgi:hypothetical protein